MRLGLIGLDNTHADHAVRHLNEERAFGDARIVAVGAGTAERATQLGIDTLLERPEDLIGQVDAAIVMDRDGDLHRPHAEPLLKAGIPVFVDKPLAGSVADAEAILAAAKAGGVPVTSSSALRWAVVAMRERLEPLGEIRSVIATGPVQRESPYGGLAFYGIHPVEMALALLPAPEGEPVVSVLPGAVLAAARAGDAHAAVNLVERDADGAVPFAIQVTGTRGVLAEQLALGKGYTLPALRVFLDMVRTGEQPLDDAELLAPVRMLAAITRAAPPR
ncbi:MAG: Gfo/Idh/MocA family oxidoreductase [Nonomuraea sp.]|nr:Gfo/Idh/MocA family oxidoreductase [Nonomuraea sp.]